MDYEQYYSDAQICFKELKDKTDAQSRGVKKIQKCLSDGDINVLPKLFAGLREAARERENALDELEKLTEAFDGAAYMADGHFTEQMIDYCKQLGVDVQGEYPVYDMFPCRVTINSETQDVMVNRKRLQCLRPSKLVSGIKLELDKLAKVSFNASQFSKELAAAYDLAIVKASAKKPCAKNAPMYALDLYDTLTPMKRSKKEYTKIDFAYDLARLFSAGNLTLDDGRTLRFDTVRDTKKTIRILDKNGSEHFITTIRYN